MPQPVVALRVLIRNGAVSTFSRGFTIMKSANGLGILAWACGAVVATFGPYMLSNGRHRNNPARWRRTLS